MRDACLALKPNVQLEVCKANPAMPVLSYGMLCMIRPAVLQALDAAKQAVGRFEAAGVPWARPPDYYAEMVKSDQHMSQVKQQLVHQQQTIEGADERWVFRQLVLSLFVCHRLPYDMLS